MPRCLHPAGGSRRPPSDRVKPNPHEISHRCLTAQHHCTAPLQSAWLHSTSLIVPHCIAPHCIAPHCTAPHCIAPHCTAPHCIAPHCSVHHSVPHCTVPHCIAPHCIAPHCTVPHSVPHCTLQVQLVKISTTGSTINSGTMALTEITDGRLLGVAPTHRTGRPNPNPNATNSPHR